jgi:xanthine dehydrogenase accessory factor
MLKAKTVLNEILVDLTTVAPQRVSADDDPTVALRFALDEAEKSGVALATLVEIRGGAARALGSHMAISPDGRFCGYVSGGCVEGAIATEALLAFEAGQDRIVKLGAGSPFFDIVLPCGGGITIAIHVVRNIAVIKEALRQIDTRQAVGLRYCPVTQTLLATEALPSRPGWRGSEFQTVYLPRPRIVISGIGPEADAVAAVAKVAGYETVEFRKPDYSGSAKVDIDAFTAVVLLHHEIDNELPVIKIALQSPAFYIGALGSKQTHRRRVEYLVEHGIERASCERIKAPIGMFGPTRDSNSLALSVLADVAAARIRAAAERPEIT